MLLLLLFQSQTSATGQWPFNIAVIGWVIAGIIALIYLYSGILQNVNSGRKELLDVNKEKLTTRTEENAELIFKVKQLEEEVAELEKEKADIERDKTMLMREHHQLLEISVADLNTLKHKTKVIEEMEKEINRYREEKGLPPKQFSVLDTRE